MKTGHKTGFTLIETLIAVAIMAIIGTMVFGSFSAVLGAGRGVEEQAELYHTARFIIRKMSEDLSSAAMYTNNTQGIFSGKGEKIGGEELSQLKFTGFGGRMAGPDTGSDQAQIVWYTVSDPETKILTLVRSENPYVIDLESSKEMAGAMEVTDKIKSFRLRYYANGEWADTYDSKNKGGALPQAVSLEFELADETGRSVKKQALMPVGGKS
ncbi:MAG: prepilin-type N-terminal cleavage/methylation domain-containing protein [Nitrospinae bacterium]|nr:prepilin-type N-terminal cleavage/methylation domain-containing protein [Nitrospinota bacterium]